MVAGLVATVGSLLAVPAAVGSLMAVAAAVMSLIAVAAAEVEVKMELEIVVAAQV